MKLCKDCAHFDGKEFCLHAPRSPDYVFGKPSGYYPADFERKSNLGDSCGTNARHFQAKVTTPADADPF